MKIKSLLVAATLVSIASLSMPVIAADEPEPVELTVLTDGKKVKITANFPVIHTISSNSDVVFQVPVTIALNDEGIPSNTTLEYKDVSLKIFTSSDISLINEDWIFLTIVDDEKEAPDFSVPGVNISSTFLFEGEVLKKGTELNANIWFKARTGGDPKNEKGFLSFFPSLSYVKTEKVEESETVGGDDAGSGTDPNRYTILTSDRPQPPPLAATSCNCN